MIVQASLEALEQQVDKLLGPGGHWQAFLIRLAMAVLILLVGSQVIRLILHWANKVMLRQKVKHEVRHFADIALKVVLYWLLLIFITDRLGGNTSSLITLLGSLGLTVGIALQGSLSDFAAGLLLIFLHPIQVGDYIFLGSTSSDLLVVKEIRFFHTAFVNPSSFRVYIRNSQVLSKEVINLSREDYVSCSVTVGIAYDCDTEQARKVLVEACSQEALRIQEVPVKVIVTELGDSQVSLTVIVKVKACDYAATKFSMTERVKQALDAAKIEIPFPQMDVHMR